MTHMGDLLDVDHEFHDLRMSALRNASNISSYVNNVTIGPNSTMFNKKANEPANNKVSDNLHNPSNQKNGISRTEAIQTENYNYDRLLHVCEKERKEAVKSAFDDMLKNMVSKQIETISKHYYQREDDEKEYERKVQERRNVKMQIFQELAADDEITKLEQEKLVQESRAHSERMKQLLQQLELEQIKLVERLNYCNSKIFECREKIVTIIQASKDVGERVYQELEPMVSQLLLAIHTIIEDCKRRDVTIVDVNLAMSFVTKMEEVKKLIIEKISSALNEKEKNLNIVEREQKKVEEPIISVPKNENTYTQNLDNKDQSNISQYYSKRSSDKYKELKIFLENYEEGYKNLLEDKSLKKFRFDCQKAVNTPVNAISSLSGAHIKDKFEKLVNLLSGNKVLIGDAYISAAQHPQGKAYCTDLLARKIVKQGELLVSSHPEAAFPIASVTIGLWSYFPEFGKLLCAHFYRECPYLIPMMMPQVSGQTDEEFYKMRGYKYSEEGVIEKQDQFLKRVSGIFKLYAAIWISKMPRCIEAPHPQDLSHAWEWFVAFINLNPEMDISATLLHDFLTICGSDFSKYYRKQFNKILKYLVTEYINKLEKVDSGGPKTRLDVFIQSVDKNNCINPPTGLISEYFW